MRRRKARGLYITIIRKIVCGKACGIASFSSGSERKVVVSETGSPKSYNLQQIGTFGRGYNVF